MNKAAFDDYLKNRYDDQMKYYATKSRENNKTYKKFQWALIILSALTPVLVALDGVKIDISSTTWIMFNIKIFVVIISSIVAILTTGLKTFSYFENYVNYRNTREELKHEKYYYEWRIGPYAEPGIHREALFVSRVESALDKEHSQWPASKKLQDQLKEKDKEHEEEPVPPTANEEGNNPPPVEGEINENPEEPPK